MSSRSPDLDPETRRFVAVYREHHAFVWQSLRCLGVRDSQLDDAMQDVFVVVHRRLPEFEGRAKVRTWLFEILRRVGHRSRTRSARDAARGNEVPELVAPGDLDAELDRTRAVELLQEFTAELDEDRLAVFMLAEFGQLRGREIAEELGVNINTVYARLRSANHRLDQLAQRVRAKDSRATIDRVRRQRPSSESRARVLSLVVGAPAGAAAGTAATSSGVWGAIKLYALGAAAGAVVLTTIVATVPESSAPPPTANVSSARPVTDHPRAAAPVLATGGEEQPASPVAQSDTPPEFSGATPDPNPPPSVAAASVAKDVSGDHALAQEVAAAAELRALVGRPGEFELAVARYRTRFSGGSLTLEVDAMVVEHGCRTSTAGAQARFLAFAKARPTSGLVARLRPVCEVSIPIQKPAGGGT